MFSLLAIIENITHQDHLKFPDDEDLSGAASALMRLQDTYLLDTSTLARGHIEGTAPSPELTSIVLVSVLWKLIHIFNLCCFLICTIIHKEYRDKQR